MAWIYLFIAAIFEIGWPLGLKMVSVSSHKFAWGAFAVVAMAASGILLYLAQKQISIGTAYAVWTGIGAAGTFIVGILFFNDVMTFMRLFGVFLIVAGVVFLKIAH